MHGWIGVDLDGTLAQYDGWKGADHIGEPIAPMVDRVKQWLAEGKEVKIFTARVYCPPEPVSPDQFARSMFCAGDGGHLPSKEDHERVRATYEEWRQRWLEMVASLSLIQKWCEQRIGKVLDVTCTKDYGMVRLYDDRCIQVEQNTGRLISAEEE